MTQAEKLSPLIKDGKNKMSGLIKKMKIMEWWKTLPFHKDITLSWSDKRPKKRWATAFLDRKTIVLYAGIFDHTFESVQHCVLHEVAHFLQYQRSGYTQHNTKFNYIKNRLLKNYGSIEIFQAKKSGTIATSSYRLDADSI